MSKDSVNAGEDPGSPIRIRNHRVDCQDLVEELKTGVEGAVDVPAYTLLQDVAGSNQDDDPLLFVVVVKLHHQITGKGGAVIIVYHQFSKADGGGRTGILRSGTLGSLLDLH